MHLVVCRLMSRPSHTHRPSSPVSTPPLLRPASPCLVPLTAVDARTNTQTDGSQQITTPRPRQLQRPRCPVPAQLRRARPAKLWAPPPGPTLATSRDAGGGGRHAVPGGRAGRAAHLLRDVRRAAAARQPPRRPHLLARGKTARLLPLLLLVSDWIDRIAEVVCLVRGIV